MDRRTFLQLAAGALAAGAAPAIASARAREETPAHLAGYEDLFELDPRAAARAWFAKAGLGLMIHCGVYSVLARGEWVMYDERIPVADYTALADTFHPDRFDADLITDLARGAGAGYVNLTARHHDGFALFHSRHSDFTCPRSAARRDIVAEVAHQCERKRLGLFLSYSYGLDWRHPYFYPRAHNPIARPDYPSPEPAYRWQRDADFRHYIEYAHAQIGELLTGYGPIAGLWLDPVTGYYARPELFPIRETYDIVRRLQPQCLISFRQGATGAEDFASFARAESSLADRVQHAFADPSRIAIASRAWEGNKAKHNEIVEPLHARPADRPDSWGYHDRADADRLTPDAARRALADARAAGTNLLLVAALLPDGSLHPSDAATLRALRNPLDKPRVQARE